MCLCGRFRNVFQIQPNCIWNPPCFIYSSSFPSVWPCFISLSSLFCQWIHFLFYLLFLVCVFVCLCVWPWLTGHCCSALQPIPLGPCLCCLFSDLDSLSLSLWVALLPLSPPPSFSLASLMLFFLFSFLFFSLFPLSLFLWSPLCSCSCPGLSSSLHVQQPWQPFSIPPAKINPYSLSVPSSLSPLFHLITSQFVFSPFCFPPPFFSLFTTCYLCQCVMLLHSQNSMQSPVRCVSIEQMLAVSCSTD